jgi:NAD(P)-dependent dehydrogenase (short-subunit alcohol dehydrogenase family)
MAVPGSTRSTVDDDWGHSRRTPVELCWATTIDAVAPGAGAVIKAMIDMSAAERIGTPDDIAAAVDFLLSPAASFITGDLLANWRRGADSEITFLFSCGMLHLIEK